jgi:transposase-like protein
MECPTCASQELLRNGYRNGVQCYRCKQCGRQFLASYKQTRYSQDVKQLCLRMYFRGMSTREIEAVTDIHHTTILSWLKEKDINLSDFLNDYDISANRG